MPAPYKVTYTYVGRVDRLRTIYACTSGWVVGLHIEVEEPKLLRVKSPSRFDVRMRCTRNQDAYPLESNG